MQLAIAVGVAVLSRQSVLYSCKQRARGLTSGMSVEVALGSAEEVVAEAAVGAVAIVLLPTAELTVEIADMVEVAETFAPVGPGHPSPGRITS